MKFTVPGNPKAWQRARVSKYGGFFTSKESVDYKNLIALYANKSGIRLTNKAVIVSIDIYLKRPLKMPKASDFGPVPHFKRPDADNFSKNYLDALNGIAYKDDGQVHSIRVTKWYHEKGGSPRAEIGIEAL